MIFSDSNLSVCAYWYDRFVVGGEFIDQTRAFLQRIMTTLPDLSILRVDRDPSEGDGLVRGDFSNFEEQSVLSLPKNYVFLNPASSSKTFTRESTAATAFFGSFSLSSREGEKELSVRVTVGGPQARATNSCVMGLSPGLESVESARTLLGLSVDFWNPHNAYVGRYEVQRLLKQPVADIKIGWLTYLTDVTAQEIVPSDIHTERFYSGVLIRATEAPGHKDDLESLENMRRVLSALGPKILSPRSPQKNK